MLEFQNNDKYGEDIVETKEEKIEFKKELRESYKRLEY